MKDGAEATDLAATTPAVEGVEGMATSGAASRSRQSRRKKSRSKSQEMDARTKVAPLERSAAKAAREKRAIQERDWLSFSVFYRCVTRHAIIACMNAFSIQGGFDF